MIQRFFAWVRSWFRKPQVPDALESFLPSRLIKPKPYEPFMQKQARLRRERKEARAKELERLANKKPLPEVEQKCVCGCGNTMKVTKGTLQFFYSRSCRARYRRAHGAINYAKHRA